MGDPKDDESGEKRRVSRDGISHDQRGNAVWKWAADSGRHLMESTSALLKRLEVPGLKLEEDATGLHKPMGKGAPGEAGGPKADVGYDPYGGKRSGAASPPRPAGASPRADPRGARPSAPRPTAPPRPATKPAAVPQPRRSLWRRLFGRD